MAGGVTVKVTDRGWDGLAERVRQLSQGAYSLVGVHGAEGAQTHPGGKLTIAQIATIHEFGKVIHTKRGTITIPARSFIRAAIDEYFAPIQKRATALGKGALLGKFTTAEALELLGSYAVGIMKQRIANRIAPPNSASTIKRKGSSVPLIDSGQLRGSITHKPEAG